MFLTAVLNAHTDRSVETLPGADPATGKTGAPAADADSIPARLNAVLALPSEERTVTLPSTHRSRSV